MISLLFLLGLAHVWCASLASGCGRAASRALSKSQQVAALSAPRSPLLLGARLRVYGTSPEMVQRMKTDLDAQVKNQPALFCAEGEVSQARCHQPGSTGVPGVPVTSCRGGTGTSQPLPGKAKPRVRSTSGMQGPTGTSCASKSPHQPQLQFPAQPR